MLVRLLYVRSNERETLEQEVLRRCVDSGKFMEYERTIKEDLQPISSLVKWIASFQLYGMI